ncbi:MAG: hypothetical protein AB1646_01195 [Thermodesulfobacteriota bacterium]
MDDHKGQREQGRTRRISARAIVDDLHSGMSDADLMVKYDLSSEKLKKVLNMLLDKGFLHPDELYARSAGQSFRGPDTSEPHAALMPNASNATAVSMGSEGTQENFGDRRWKIRLPKRSTVDKALNIVGMLAFFGTIAAICLIAPSPMDAFALVLSFFLGVGCLALVLFAIIYLDGRSRKKPASRTTYLVVSVVLLAIGIYLTIPKAVEERIKAPRVNLNEARILEIMKRVMENADYLTPEVHHEFWRIFDDAKIKPQEVRLLRDKIMERATEYHKMFWADALRSLKTGRPYKSKKRADFERRMIEKRGWSPETFRKREGVISRIAAGEPIEMRGTTAVINEESIRWYHQNVREFYPGIEKLFTRPY